MNSYVNYLFQFSTLSQATYARFRDVGNPALVSQDLQASNLGDFTENQALQFIGQSGYLVLDQSEPESSGFSGSVFKNQKTGAITLAFRGTEFLPKLDLISTLQDVGADTQIVTVGIAYEQVISMYNYYQRLITPANAQAVQLDFDIIVSTDSIPDEPHILIDAVPNTYLILKAGNAAQGLGVLEPDTKINVAGHSLGGHLAAVFTRLFPGVVDEAYMFNSPGFDPPNSLRQADDFISLFSGSTDTFDPNVITNIVGEEGVNFPDFVANLGTPPVEQKDIYIEELQHSIVDVVDSLALQSVLGKIDTALTPETALAMLNLLSNRVENSLETMLDSLGKLFLGIDFSTPEFTSKNDVNARNDYHGNIQELLTQLETRFPGDSSPLTLISLDGIPASELASRAGEGRLDILYALLELNPFAIGSTDAGAVQVLYQPFVDSGLLNLDQYSSDYLSDRARFLVTLIDYNGEDWAYSNQTTNATFYQDLEKSFSIGAVNALFEGESIQNPRIVFGSRGNDTITGSEPFSGLFGRDHLYGNSGDDLILGLEGSDHLEGNAGNDTLIGGINKEVDDTESDTLQGGDGFDTYHAGNGDILKDTDGKGRVSYNGIELTLGFHASDQADGEYTSIDGKFTYTLTGPDLLVSVVDSDPPVSFTIQNFSSGSLGIVLRDKPDTKIRTSIKVYEYWSIEEYRIQNPGARMAA